VHPDEAPLAVVGRVPALVSSFERPAPARLELVPDRRVGAGPAQDHLVREPGVVVAFGDAQRTAVDGPPARRLGLFAQSRRDIVAADESLGDAELDGVLVVGEEGLQRVARPERVVVGPDHCPRLRIGSRLGVVLTHG